MKQIVQNLKTGETLLEEIPAPIVKPGHLLVKTRRTLVSAGTERMLVEFGSASLVQKARQQPDKVRMVLDKIRSDGLLPTLEAVFTKLGQPLPLGYCNVGEVIEVGRGVGGFRQGDRVVSNGPHAEFVCVPENLCALIPEDVDDDSAAFTVVGSIGLQGIRLIEPTLGETIVVVGLGLIGLISAQLLVANGCNVIGIDLDPAKVDLANDLGIHAINPAAGVDDVSHVLEKSKGIGADGVLITAASSSNELVSSAARMSRKRGRIVLVGSVGLTLARSDFYEKELSFQVSCSYGPGRYDPRYEEQGNDYPIGFVRWTEKRNFEAVLNALATKRIDTKPLVSEIVNLSEFQKIYGAMSKSNSIGSLLRYGQSADRSNKVSVLPSQFKPASAAIAIIGAGNFTSATLLPALRAHKASLKTIVSAGGLSAKTLAAREGIAYASTDFSHVLQDPEISLVMITTRHNLHAEMVIEAIRAGKHVFVEKPLCLAMAELEMIVDALNDHEDSVRPQVTVGFNRRFAPFSSSIKKHVGDTPSNVVATMNAGAIPESSWVHDMEIGGGRVVGEACHLVDLCIYLTGSLVKAVCMTAMGPQYEENTDNASIFLRHANGSNSTVNYFANGNKAYAKERVEMHTQGRSLVVDNWRELRTFGLRKDIRMRKKQDKGHAAQFGVLLQALRNGGPPPIPLVEILNVSKASFAALQSLRENRWIEIES